jgi:predicted Rossmann fold nucleotide-binding protein DprA/Smf involved in DNA uptake
LKNLPDVQAIKSSTVITELPHASFNLAPEPAVAEHLGQDPVGLDELQIRSGLSVAQLQAELFQLELKGALGRLPGGLYQRLTRRI